MLYRSKTLRVLCPLIRIATTSGIPRLIMKKLRQRGRAQTSTVNVIASPDLTVWDLLDAFWNQLPWSGTVLWPLVSYGPIASGRVGFTAAVIPNGTKDPT